MLPEWLIYTLLTSIYTLKNSKFFPLKWELLHGFHKTKPKKDDGMNDVTDLAPRVLPKEPLLSSNRSIHKKKIKKSTYIQYLSKKLHN